MEKLKEREHDFSAKLRQRSIIEGLRQYIAWQREVRNSASHKNLPLMGPVSINLDLTTACNFRCPHCVDSGIINTGEQIDFDTISESIETLKRHGLKSVILIGGGEPTVHRDFEKIVEVAKGSNLQVGIATNGSKLERVKPVAGLLTEGDWVRLSLDAAREDTFRKSHQPPAKVTLDTILSNARDIKKLNPAISLGYSYVIVWEGISYNGVDLFPNIEEMPEAVTKACEFGFDYVSYKPCLLRLEGSGKESLFDPPDPGREERVINLVRGKVLEAESLCGKSVKVLKSVNLQAMLECTLHELKKQPVTCHSQLFRTVLAPSGVFHCPALRGVSSGCIADKDGYRGEERFLKTQKSLEESVRSFDAAKECSVVVCFYHHVNWWIERFIQSGRDVSEIEEVEDNNFFL